MARPRVIRVSEDKEVTLKNFSSEEADAIKNVILNLNNPDVSTSEERATPKVAVTLEGLNFFAVGTFKEGNEWKFALVRYNPTTGEAKVEKTEICGDYKEAAVERFKINAANLNLV